MSEDAFNASYAKLNAAQKRAVDAIEGPVMVIAGPGTGKTTILTLRIANILKQTDTPPSGILAITYTDAGVKAMRQKLRDIIGTRAHEVEISTFHGFASAMIAEYPDHFPELQGVRNLTDVEQESLIRDIIEDRAFSALRPIGKPDAYVPAIIRSIDAAKREALTPDMVRAHARTEIERIKADPASISTRGTSKGKLKAEAEELIGKCERTALFADAYERYEKEKREGKRMDWNDLIISLLAALRRDELLLRLIQERFLYLLVDEHQDTNDAQNFIVSLIAEFFDTPNIFIVGDEKQAIYRFQGASVENFLSLQKKWPAMEVISLDTNYRSHQAILDASFSMIENNYAGDEHRDLRIELKEAGQQGEGSKEKGNAKNKPRPIDIVTGENVPAIEAHLVSELKAIMENEPSATVAVITRRNRDLERVIRLLESAHIPVSSERSVDIFHHPVGAVFFDLIGYLADPARTDALARTIAAGMWGIPFEEGTRLIRSLRSGANADLESKIPAIAFLQRRMQEDGAAAFLINAAEASGFAALAARDPAAIHVWRGIVSLAESLAREGDIQSPQALMESLLAYRLSAETKTVKVSVGAPDLAIRAMTAHGSKGLEFDYVFIPYATEEAWVGRAHGSSFVLPQKQVAGSDIRDTRRLFYVALTRAKKHAVIMTALEESDGKALTLLRFIAELDPKSVAPASLPRANAELPQGDGGRDAGHSAGPDGAKNAQTERSAKLISLAKEVLLGTGLSVTALNHFLECPSKFMYLSILKLPQAPSPAAEKGTAMHEAVSCIWQSPDRSVGMIETIIREAVADYLARSLLSASEKEAVKEELYEAAPAVAVALAPHFNAYGIAGTGGSATAPVRAAIFTERWVEADLDASYKGEKIRIPIHGKLDALADSGDALDVFDYKTRQSMSVAEIKGETKNSTGDYFRQLVFYRLLLESDPRRRGKKITPALVFLSPDKKGRCPLVSLPIAPDDVDAIRKHIQEVVESVWSGGIAAKRCDDRDCEWCGLARLSY